MPFELNIRVAPIDPTHEWYADEAERDARAYRAGNVISVKPFGWSSSKNWADSAYNFSGQNRDAGYFCCVVCPDGPEMEAIRGYLDREWRDDFKWTINASYPAQGRYNVTVRNATASASGKYGLTKAKIETWLLGWGASSVTFATNEATFDFKLWDAVRSWRFWGTELINSYVDFSLISYSATTKIGRIQIAEKISLPDKMVADKIAERGGSIISSTAGSCTAEFEASDIYAKFKVEVNRFGQKILRRRRYQLTDKIITSICADAMANSGRAEYSWAELQAALLDGMAE